MDVICQAKSGMGKTAVFVISTLQQLEPVDGQVGEQAAGQGDAGQGGAGRAAQAGRRRQRRATSGVGWELQVGPRAVPAGWRGSTRCK